MNTPRHASIMVFLTLFSILATRAPAQTVALVEAVICREVVERMPVAPGNMFPAGIERLFCFTRIEGGREQTEITHNWYHQGVLKASVVLPVRGSNWRTWSSKALLPEWTGEWMVEVLAADGSPLESIIFSVE